MKDVKSKEYIPNKPLVKRSVSKKNHPRVLSQKPSHPNLGESNKSLNLFDNIQNYLENPH